MRAARELRTAFRPLGCGVGGWSSMRGRCIGLRPFASSKDDGQPLRPQGTVIEGGQVKGTDIEGGTPVEDYETDATKQKLPQQEIAQEIGSILRKYHDDHNSGDDGDVSVKSVPNARKEAEGHDKVDAKIHVVVSRVRKQQIEKARASGALKGVVVERR